MDPNVRSWEAPFDVLQPGAPTYHFMNARMIPIFQIVSSKPPEAEPIQIFVHADGQEPTVVRPGEASPTSGDAAGSGGGGSGAPASDAPVLAQYIIYAPPAPGGILLIGLPATGAQPPAAAAPAPAAPAPAAKTAAPEPAAQKVPEKSLDSGTEAAVQKTAPKKKAGSISPPKSTAKGPSVAKPPRAAVADNSDEEEDDASIDSELAIDASVW